MNLKIDTLEVEEISDKEKLEDQFMDISRKKSIGLLDKYPEEYIVSADTIVIDEDEVLGKPKDKIDAKRMLSKLSGKKHRVITAFTILNKKLKIDHSSYDETFVYFKNLQEKEIDWYIETNEPMDKAGSYGIQGKGSILIEKIEGDFYNVMGFPISKFYDELKDLGIDLKRIK